MFLSLRTLLVPAAALAAGVAVQACSLNPQPLPPGYTGGDNTDGGTETVADASVGGDAGFLGGSDAGASVDSAQPGTPGVDGGADGAPNGSGDGASDAPTDSPTVTVGDGGTE
jgi:hypothetical protein